jgi:hypothetical protein
MVKMLFTTSSYYPHIGGEEYGIKLIARRPYGIKLRDCEVRGYRGKKDNA